MLMWLGVAACIVGVMWWLQTSPAEKTQEIYHGDGSKLDEHATIKRLIEQAQSEKVKQLLRETGKALYDTE